MEEQIKAKKENDDTERQGETSKQQLTSEKSLIDSVLIFIIQFIGKPWHKLLPAFKICNQFTVTILLLFFASAYLPAIKFLSMNESFDISLFQIMILIVALLHGLGVKQKVSKISLAILLLTVLYQLNEISEYIPIFSKEALQVIALGIKHGEFRYGLYIWIATFIILVVVLILPFYRSNKNLWPQIIEVMKTKTESNIDVQKATSNVRAHFQSSIKKGKTSIEKTDSPLISQLILLTTNKILRISAASILVIIILSMIFSGNSAPLSSDVESLFQNTNQGLLTTEYSNISVNKCEEISNKKLPTFECEVSGVVSTTSKLLGLNDRTKFTDTYIFEHGEDGWY